MYAGTTIHSHSGWLLGAHQRIDRVARRHFEKIAPSRTTFPSIADILHFEGNNGPDAIKRKSPSQDEPWHFINPDNPNDTTLLGLINNHSYNLASALRTGNEQRAAFEAAWLAHAIVDGLTPAHHYPLEEKIEELWGKPHHERSSKREKAIIKGVNRRDSLSKNWQYWGAGGVFSRHFLFEWGVSTTILFYPFRDIGITKKDLRAIEKDGIAPYFMDMVQAVAKLNMYGRYAKQGWTHVLASDIRRFLIPRIAKTVVLAWYDAAYQAQRPKK